MGNQVIGGASFAEVAKAGSDSLEAPKGGKRDWTTKGGLDCEAINEALFALPVGQMSPIIEGPRGYHIIRVTQREDTVVRPFLEAQVDIKKIVEQRSQKQFREYIETWRTRRRCGRCLKTRLAPHRLRLLRGGGRFLGESQ